MLNNATPQCKCSRKNCTTKVSAPLLIGKEVNPVLRLAIHATEAKTLTALSIHVPANATDIESMQLFALNQDSSFITDAKLAKATVIAKTAGSKIKSNTVKRGI